MSKGKLKIIDMREVFKPLHSLPFKSFNNQTGKLEDIPSPFPTRELYTEDDFEVSIHPVYYPFKDNINFGDVKSCSIPTRVTLDELVYHVSNGGSFIPSIFFDYPARNDSWWMSPMIPLDFDDVLTFEKFMKLSHDYGLIPNVTYRTYSDTEKCHKFRAIYLFNHLFIDPVLYSSIQDIFKKLFPQLDSAALTISHIFAGTNKEVTLHTKERISMNHFIQVIKTYMDEIENRDVTNETKNNRFNTYMRNKGIICSSTVTYRDVANARNDVWFNSPFEDMTNLDWMADQQQVLYSLFEYIKNPEAVNLSCIYNDIGLFDKLNSIRLVVTYLYIYKERNKHSNTDDNSIKPRVNINYSVNSNNNILYRMTTNDSHKYSKSYKRKNITTPTAQIIKDNSKHYKRNVRWTAEESVNQCMLLEQIMSDDKDSYIPYYDRVVLVSNLCSDIEGERMRDGDSLIDERIKKGIECGDGKTSSFRWNIIRNRIKSLPNPEKLPPWSCNQCSKKDICKSVEEYKDTNGDIPSNINILKITRLYANNKSSIYYDPDGNPDKSTSSTLEESMYKLRAAVAQSREREDNKVYLILADTGTGKTYNLLKYGQLDGCIIATPTHALKDEIFEKYEMGSSSDLWVQPTPPTLPPIWEMDLAIMRAQKRDVIKTYMDYLESNDNDVGLKQQVKRYVDKVLKFRRTGENHRAMTILCTHDYLYYNYMNNGVSTIPEQIHTVIFDEDPLETSIKMNTFSESELRGLLDWIYDVYMNENEDKRNEVNDIYEYLKSFQVTDHTEQNQIVSLEDKGIDKLDEDVILDLTRKYIRYIKRPINLDVFFLPKEIGIITNFRNKHVVYTGVYGYDLNTIQQKIIVLSATASPKTYISIIESGRLARYDLRGTDLRGTVYCFPRKSFSKSFINDPRNRKELEEVYEVHKDLYDDGLLIIYKEEVDKNEKFKHKRNFGGLIGEDKYNGYKTLVIGTPYLPPHICVLLDRYHGGTTTFDSILDRPIGRQVRQGDYVTFIHLPFQDTQENRNLQNIMMGHAETQIIQSIGRPRLVINETEAWLYSKIIVPGAIVTAEHNYKEYLKTDENNNQ